MTRTSYWRNTRYVAKEPDTHRTRWVVFDAIDGDLVRVCSTKTKRHAIAVCGGNARTIPWPETHIDNVSLAAMIQLRGIEESDVDWGAAS